MADKVKVVFKLSVAGAKGASSFFIQLSAFIPRSSQDGMIIKLASPGSAPVVTSKKRPVQ